SISVFTTVVPTGTS
nr:immunoglobulin heavy chain junction region [Mus musculus]